MLYTATPSIADDPLVHSMTFLWVRPHHGGHLKTKGQHIERESGAIAPMDGVRYQPCQPSSVLRSRGLLANYTALSGAPPVVQVNALIDTMETETLPSGEWLMREGEPGDAMYVIKTGKMEVYVGGRLTRNVGRGCAVGELALLYHTPRSASVKVRKNTPKHQVQRF